MLLTACFAVLVGGDFGADAMGQNGLDTVVRRWDQSASEFSGLADVHSGAGTIPSVIGERPMVEVLPSGMSLEGGLDGENPALGAVLQGKEPGDLSINVSVRAEWSMPFGTADHHSVTAGGVVYVTKHLDWGDIFEPGWGVNLQADFFLGSKEASFNSGIGLLLSSNEFNIGRVANDLGGDISFDRMSMSTLLIGGTFIGAIGDGFYTKGFAGIGPVRYSSVTGTFTGTFATFDREVIRNTWQVAGALRFDIGIRFGHLGIVAGAGVRIQAPPDASSSVSLNSGIFYTFDVDLGVELGF